MTLVAYRAEDRSVAWARLLAASGQVYAAVDWGAEPGPKDVIERQLGPLPIPPSVVTAGGDDDGAKASYSSLYFGETGARLYSVAPVLLSFLARKDLLESLWSADWRIGGFVLFVSDAPFVTLRNHLRRFTIARHPNGTSILFRVGDPRVVHAFLDESTESERAAFLGPCLEIVLRDPVTAVVHTLRRPRAGQDLIAKQPIVDRVGMFTLRDQHVRAFDDLAHSTFCSGVAETLRRTAPTLTAARSEAQLREHVSACCADAHKYGVSSRRDLARWSLLALIGGRSFHAAPVINRVLNDPSEPISERLASLVRSFVDVARAVGAPKSRL